MSIRAMNWAMAARTDGVSAQCVLFVVADTANEHGISIHADPDYIAERTRQSRATVFRRLKELEDAGALTRLKRYREDGAPVYEIRLRLDRDIDYTSTPDAAGEAQDIEAESQFETPPESQIETPKVAPVRQAESQSCDSKSPSKNPEDSPPTPQGGKRDTDQDREGEEQEPSEPEGWPAFKAEFEADHVPIMRVSLAKQIFAALKPPERALATKAAAGLIVHRSREKKPGMKPAAQTFLREPESWPGWAQHAPPEPPKPVAKTTLAAGSAEFGAFLLCRAIARRPPLTGDVSGVQFPGDVPTGAAGLAAVLKLKPGTFDVDPSDWTLEPKGTPRYVAWSERVKEWLGVWPEEHRFWLDEFGNIVPSATQAYRPPGKHLPKCCDGLLLPPTHDGWPPPKGATGPPD